MSALIWWGSRSDSEPADAVDLALRELEAGFAQRRYRSGVSVPVK
jgi:hypothetical protein